MAATAAAPRSIAAYAGSEIARPTPPRDKSRNVGKLRGLPMEIMRAS
jgi:hypothetical protein